MAIVASIEVHGLPDDRAEEIIQRIKELFEHKSYAHEYTLSNIPSDSIPFLRVFSIEQGHTHDITKELKILGLEMQVITYLPVLPE